MSVSSNKTMADQVIYLINEERKKLGIKQLYAVPYLNECAEIRAKDQLEQEGHWRPNGDYWTDVIDIKIIPWLYTAENIALGTANAEDTVKYWKNSSNHWKNAVSDNFSHTGVGVYYDENSTRKWHWVQIFTNDAHSSSAVYEGQYLPQNQEIQNPPEPEIAPDMILSCKDSETNKEFSGITVDITSTTNKNPNFSTLKVMQGDTTISYTTALDFYKYKTATFTTGSTETKIFGLPTSETFIVKVHTPIGYYSTCPISTSDYYYTYTHSQTEEQFSLNFLPREFTLKVVDAYTGEVVSGAVFDFKAISQYKNEVDDVEVIQNGQPYPHTAWVIAQNKKAVNFTTNSTPIMFRKIPGNIENVYADSSYFAEKSSPEGYKSTTSNILIYWNYTSSYLQLRPDSDAHIENGNVLVIKKEKNVINFHTFQQTLDGTLQELSGAEYKLSYSGTGTFANTSSPDNIYINTEEKSIFWTSTGTTQIFGLPNG
ncbi:MAG: CAP domain-containing protein, partial [Ruminococcus sp.]|nr:CAP domain-containing protein [Ruminococcus sp.]